MKERVKEFLAYISQAVDQFNETPNSGSTKQYQQIEIGKPDPFDYITLVIQNPICYYIPVGDGLYRPTMDKRIFCTEACRVIREAGDSISMAENLNVLLQHGFQMYDLCLALKQSIHNVNSIRILDNTDVPPFLKQAWHSCFGVTCDWYYSSARVEKKRIQDNPPPIEESVPPCTKKEEQPPKDSSGNSSTDEKTLSPENNLDSNPSTKEAVPFLSARGENEVLHNEFVRELARKVATQLSDAKNKKVLEEWEFGVNGNPGWKTTAKITDKDDLSEFDFILIQEVMKVCGRAKTHLNLPMFSKWLKNTHHLHSTPFVTWNELISFIDWLSIPHACFIGNGIPSIVFGTSYQNKKISGTYGERINYKVGYKLCFDGTSRTEYSLPVKDKGEDPVNTHNEETTTATVEAKPIPPFKLDAFVKVIKSNQVFWPISAFGKLESFVRASGNSMVSFHQQFKITDEESGMAEIPSHFVDEFNTFLNAKAFK